MTKASESLKKSLAASLAVLFLFSITIVPDTHAMLAPAQTAPATLTDGSSRGENMEKVQAFLQTKIVRQRLADLGMSEEEINTRLGRLSDEEMQQVAMHIQQQAPAGDGVVFVLVVVILVLLVIYLAKRV